MMLTDGCGYSFKMVRCSNCSFHFFNWKTIKVLRNIFATHGLPEIIVSDNGTAFTSNEIQAFLRISGIRHISSSPYHPS